MNWGFGIGKYSGTGCRDNDVSGVYKQCNNTLTDRPWYDGYVNAINYSYTFGDRIFLTLMRNIYAKGDKIPEFNYCCPLMSLPLKLNINHIKYIPKYSSYLNFNAERVKRWENLFEKKKINIGINWESGSVSMFKGRSFKLNNLKKY